MDRSFLSQPAVVEASRAFVCIRLQTYENAEEARMLSNLFVGRSGQLENTVFALLAPDGRTPLAPPGRGPVGVRDAEGLAARMAQISQAYPLRTPRPQALPRAASVRLALNVAACDNLPLVICYARDSQRRKELENSLATLAWLPELQGQAVYASTGQIGDLTFLGGTTPREGWLVVEADEFGLQGRLLAQLPEGQDPGPLRRALQEYHIIPKVMPRHMQEGHRRGLRWQTAVPVTDPEGRY